MTDVEQRSAEELADAFECIPPRDAALLSRAVIDGEPRERCAERYGVPPESFDTMLFRAARELRGVLERRRLPVLSANDERSGADAIGEVVKSQSENSADVRSLRARPAAAEAALCARLISLRAPLRVLLDAVEQDRTTGARGRRETWVRRALLVVLVVTAAFFYWRQEHRPKLERRPRRIPALSRLLSVRQPVAELPMPTRAEGC